MLLYCLLIILFIAEDSMKKLVLFASMTLLYTSLAFAQNAVQAPNKTPDTLYAHPEVQWFRQSAERTAIDYELFYIAENMIKQKVYSQNLRPKQWGVILDIDETLLNNSEWDYQHSINHTAQTWDEFAALAKSTALPGAVEFTNHIHQMGGYVNLVSNRNIDLMDATKQNLRDQHIYFDQILLDATKQGTSFVDKNSRFGAIIKGKTPSQLPPQVIVAWLGDNIQDFPHLEQSELAKNSNHAAYHLFGKTYFAFPNPLYGSWQVK